MTRGLPQPAPRVTADRAERLRAVWERAWADRAITHDEGAAISRLVVSVEKRAQIASLGFDLGNCAERNVAALSDPESRLSRLVRQAVAYFDPQMRALPAGWRVLKGGLIEEDEPEAA